MFLNLPFLFDSPGLAVVPVFGNRVYCATAYLDPPGTYGSVFCLDAITGELLWETFLKSPSPEVDFKGFFSSPN